MSLYNFGYTNNYYNTHLVIKQTCDICGNKKYSETAMEICVVCEQNICSSCNLHGFCEKHYNSLTLEEKNKIKIQEIQFHHQSNRYFFEIFALTIFLFIGFILLTLSSLISWTFILAWILILTPVPLMFKIGFNYFKVINQETIFKKKIFSNHR